MDRKIWIVVLALLAVMPGALASSIGVVQDYMEDGIVKVPQGMALVCHSISPATDPTINNSAVRINVTGMPSFVTADLNPDGIYPTTKGHGDGVTFFIRAPQDAAVGTEWHVSFTVSGVNEKISAGMVPLTGRIGSGFTIRIVNATDKPYMPKCEVHQNEIPETILNRDKYFPPAAAATNSSGAGTPITIGVPPPKDDGLIMGLSPLAIVAIAVVGIVAAFVFMKKRKTKVKVKSVRRDESPGPSPSAVAMPPMPPASPGIAVHVSPQAKQLSQINCEMQMHAPATVAQTYEADYLPMPTPTPTYRPIAPVTPQMAWPVQQQPKPVPVKSMPTMQQRLEEMKYKTQQRLFEARMDDFNRHHTET